MNRPLIRLPPCFVHGAMVLPSEQFLLLAHLDRESLEGWTFPMLRKKVSTLLEESDGMELKPQQVQEVALWCLYRWIEFEFVRLHRDGPTMSDRRWVSDPDMIERYLAWEDAAKASDRILKQLERLGHRRNRKEWLRIQSSDDPDACHNHPRRWCDWTHRPKMVKRRRG